MPRFRFLAASKPLGITAVRNLFDTPDLSKVFIMVYPAYCVFSSIHASLPVLLLAICCFRAYLWRISVHDYLAL